MEYTDVRLRLERELEESGAAEEGEAKVKMEVLDAGPDKTGGGILVSMAKAGASLLLYMYRCL